MSDRVDNGNLGICGLCGRDPQALERKIEQLEGELKYEAEISGGVIGRLQEEVDELRRFRQLASDASATVGRWEAKYQRLAAESRKMRTALRQYADRDNWGEYPRSYQWRGGDEGWTIAEAAVEETA